MQTTPHASGQLEVAGTNPADLSLFPAGGWRTTNSPSTGLASVSVDVAGGDLILGLSWVGDGGVVSWSPAKMENLYADAAGKAVALAGTCDLGALRCRVQANVTQGLLVLAAFNQFPPGSGRTDFFSRSFFYPVGDDLDGAGGRLDMTGLAPRATSTIWPAVDPAPLAGTWVNTNPSSIGIVRYVISVRGTRVVAGALMADGRDLGEAAAEIYAKDGEPPEPMAFLATFDAGDREFGAQARLNLGLLVVAYFCRMKDGQTNYYTREFYRRA